MPVDPEHLDPSSADAPVLVCGNGIGVLGDANAACTAPAAAGAPTAPAGRVPPMPGRLGASAGGVVPASSATSLGRAGGTGGNTTGGARGGDSWLAYTGSSVGLPMLGGLLAVALGLGLTALSRRRIDALG